MFGQKTLAEIREELQAQGIDTERLREELTESFERSKCSDTKCIRKLTELLDILNAQVAANQSGDASPHSLGKK